MSHTEKQGVQDEFGTAEHWREKAQYWAEVAHQLRGQALRGEPVDGIVNKDAHHWSVVANHWTKATFKYDHMGNLASFVVSIDLAEEGLRAKEIEGVFEDALSVIAKRKNKE